MFMIIALSVSLLIGAVHFWNERFAFQKAKTKARALSFIAGASVAYVFLYLLPDPTKAASILTARSFSLFFWVLAPFIC